VTTDPAEDASLREVADELAIAGQLPRFLLMYKFAIEELMTKLRILSEEFDFVHQHDPIEHITSRVKRPEAIKEKVTVGAALPVGIDLLPVPTAWGPTLTKYNYVYHDNRVVLVEPADRKVIQIID